MSLEVVTVAFCMDMFEKERHYTIINDGKVIGFVKEDSRRIDGTGWKKILLSRKGGMIIW